MWQLAGENKWHELGDVVYMGSGALLTLLPAERPTRCGEGDEQGCGAVIGVGQLCLRFRTLSANPNECAVNHHNYGPVCVRCVEHSPWPVEMRAVQAALPGMEG